MTEKTGTGPEPKTSADRPDGKTPPAQPVKKPAGAGQDVKPAGAEPGGKAGGDQPPPGHGRGKKLLAVELTMFVGLVLSMAGFAGAAPPYLPESTWFLKASILTEAGLFIMMLTGAVLFKTGVGWVAELLWGKRLGRAGLVLMFTAPFVLLITAAGWEAAQASQGIMGDLDAYTLGLRIASALKTICVILYLLGMLMYALAMSRSRMMAWDEHNSGWGYAQWGKAIRTGQDPHRTAEERRAAYEQYQRSIWGGQTQESQAGAAASPPAQGHQAPPGASVVDGGGAPGWPQGASHRHQPTPHAPGPSSPHTSPPCPSSQNTSSHDPTYMEAY